jgi:hypothetical protein
MRLPPSRGNATRALSPATTRACVDFVVDALRRQRCAERLPEASAIRLIANAYKADQSEGAAPMGA